jgi:hypothetical protein
MKEIPMKKHLSRTHPSENGHVLLSIVFVALFLTLSACNLPFSSANKTNTTSTPAPSKPTPSPTPTPSIKLGAQSCPTSISSPNYWNPIIPVQTNVNKVETITCGNLLGKPALQALVTVRNNGGSGTLNVYVYDDIVKNPPTKVFSLQNLVKGSAAISTYNTLLTSEVNQNSPQNRATSSVATNINREFKWSDSTGTLVPIAFPGIFPAMNRYQAETDQQMVNQGQNAWMLSPTQVAMNFVTNPLLLKWSTGSTPTINSGGGKTDADAVVTVKNSAPGNHTVQLTMSRLEGNTNGGIWIITGVTSPGLSLTSPTSLNRVSSPVNVTGTGPAFEGVVGSAAVLDSHYNRLGQSQARGTHGNGQTPFSSSLPYKETFQNGTEEGVIAIYSISNVDGSIAGATMVKTLLNYAA